jgi:hypothetical protein
VDQQPGCTMLATTQGSFMTRVHMTLNTSTLHEYI